jgi:hypothetical protein
LDNTASAALIKTAFRPHRQGKREHKYHVISELVVVHEVTMVATVTNLKGGCSQSAATGKSS